MPPSRLSVTALIAAAVTSAAACAPRVSVRTNEAPDANIAAYRTFRVLSPPARRPSAPVLPQDDPMLDNSATNQALREELRVAFETRGYGADRQNPDFLVAYYAGNKEKFDTTYWDPGPYRYSYWGYRDRWAWPYYGWAPLVAQVREQTQGTVVVDVIDAKTQQLVWRGQGREPVSSEPKQYTKDLTHAIDEVVRRFPAATARVSQSR